jgi:hypothetical protein
MLSKTLKGFWSLVQVLLALVFVLLMVTSAVWAINNGAFGLNYGSDGTIRSQNQITLALSIFLLGAPFLSFGIRNQVSPKTVKFFQRISFFVGILFWVLAMAYSLFSIFVLFVASNAGFKIVY